MQKVHNFSESVKVGNKGEAFIIDYLEKSPNVKSILDVSDKKMYQEIEVDLILKMTNDEELKIEVKTDTYTSGNIYYETVSAVETKSVGGFEKTQADYIFYFFINLNTLYILERKEYQKWFRKNQEAFKEKGYEKKVLNNRWNGTKYTSVGYAFPVTLLEETPHRWLRKVYLN